MKMTKITRLIVGCLLLDPLAALSSTVSTERLLIAEKRFCSLILIPLTIMLCVTASLRAMDDFDVAKSRFARLSRGINLGWLNNKNFKLDRTAAERDVQLVQATGCRNIRLYLNVDALRDPETREKPSIRGLTELDAAIELALRHDLAVIVDPFHYGAGGLLTFPGPEEPEAEVMVKFWAALAAHLAKYDPERVFFEVANEPCLENPLDWYTVEIRILKAMRENAPRHTLIAGYNQRVSKNNWDALKALTLFPEIADKNVVFNFHYYHPMALTHQGASWCKSAASKLQGVPYPMDPAVLDPLIARAEDPGAKQMLQNYRQGKWNRQKIEAELAVVSDWAKQRGVLVTCNEFGVYRKVAPVSARAAWTRDVRESLEKFGIGWTIWDNMFGFLPRQNGNTSLDEDIVKALGLKMP